MRIVVVDDHEVVREGLSAVLTADQKLDISVVGEAANGADAVALARRQRPDVMLVDFRLPDTTGDELCAAILEHLPACAVVILTTYLSDDVVSRCMNAGAAGFVTKAAGLDELRRVLGDVKEGRHSLDRRSASSIVDRFHKTAGSVADGTSITQQQERVLELVAEGRTYAEVGRALHISESTVRFHIRGLKDRLGAQNRAELIVKAMRAALISPGMEQTGA